MQVSMNIKGACVRYDPDKEILIAKPFFDAVQCWNVADWFVVITPFFIIALFPFTAILLGCIFKPKETTNSPRVKMTLEMGSDGSDSDSETNRNMSKIGPNGGFEGIRMTADDEFANMDHRLPGFTTKQK